MPKPVLGGTKDLQGGIVKKIYIASYHQSKFGKLFAMTVPEIIINTVNETCAEIGAEPAAIDVASVGATCNFSLNEQGLLAGLVAMVPGLGAKPIEAVETYGILSEPWIYVVDAAGTIVSVFEGVVADDELEAAFAAVDRP